MELRRKIFVILAILASCSALAQTVTRIPVLAYYGVPRTYASHQAYLDMHDAGFDVSIMPMGAADAIYCLDKARGTGVKLIVGGSSADFDDASLVSMVMGHPALYGYYVADEPQAGKIKSFGKRIENIKKRDANAFCYVNMLPFTGDKTVAGITQARSYEDYVRQVNAIGVPVLSFDFYPITRKGLKEENWFRNLEQIRKSSAKFKKSFWGFVLCTPHFVYPDPTIGTLRLQINANLAYGAKAIEYFTYWTPKAYGDYDFHDAPIDIKGKKTATYSLVKEMNTDLRSYSPLFAIGKVQNVYHIGRVPSGTKRLTSMPTNVKSIEVSGTSGAIVSLLTKGKKKYMVVVNKDYRESVNFRIVADGNKVHYITNQLVSEPLKERYILKAGGLLIFELN